MPVVEKSIEVQAPVREVYNQWTQFEEFPEFMEGVERVVQVDDTHLHWEAEIAGRHKEWEANIVEQVPDQKIAWVSYEGPENAGIVSFASVNGSTSVTLQMEYDPEGAIEGIGDKLGFLERQVDTDLKNFKHFIERRGVATGGWRGKVESPNYFGDSPTGGEAVEQTEPGPGSKPGMSGGDPGMTGTPNA